MLEIKFLEYLNNQEISSIISIAEEVWPKTYEPILPVGQPAYMLKKLFSEEALINRVKQGSRFALLILHRELIGFAEYSFQNPTQLFLSKIYVLSNWQGKGLGQTLLLELEEMAEGIGIHSVRLQVNRNNSALNFYKKLGYKVIGEVDLPFDEYWLNDYILEKQIANDD